MAKQQRKPRNRKPRNKFKSNDWINKEVQQIKNVAKYVAKKIIKETDNMFANVTASDVSEGFRNKILTKKFGDHNNPWDRM